jgi:hypothetical protein
VDLREWVPQSIRVARHHIYPHAHNQHVLPSLKRCRVRIALGLVGTWMP